jgi:hypothetical protein
VCHHPDLYQAYIPGVVAGNTLEIVSEPHSESVTVVSRVEGQGPFLLTVNKALLCDLAWALLKHLEPPHIQDELIKLERKANW